MNGAWVLCLDLKLKLILTWVFNLKPSYSGETPKNIVRERKKNQRLILTRLQILLKNKTIDSNIINLKSFPDLCVTTTSLQQSSQENNKKFKRSKLIWQWYGIIFTMASWPWVLFSLLLTLNLIWNSHFRNNIHFNILGNLHLRQIGCHIIHWVHEWMNLIPGCIWQRLSLDTFYHYFQCSNKICLWIGVAVIGNGTSSMWLCMFSYIEDYFAVTSKIASSSICICTHRRVYYFTYPFISSDPMISMWVILLY